MSGNPLIGETIKGTGSFGLRKGDGEWKDEREQCTGDCARNFGITGSHKSPSSGAEEPVLRGQ